MTSPFPTDKEGRAQLWSQMKAQLPELMDLMDTLKSQGITSKVVSFTDVNGTTTGEEPPSDEQLWQVDDALVQRVDLQNAKDDWESREAKRKEKRRIDGNKRKLKS